MDVDKFNEHAADFNERLKAELSDNWIETPEGHRRKAEDLLALYEEKVVMSIEADFPIAGDPLPELVRLHGMLAHHS